MSPAKGLTEKANGSNRPERGTGNNLEPFSADERLHFNSATQGMHSPCYIHSRLDSVLETSRRDQAYFSAHHNDQMPSIQQRQQHDANVQNGGSTSADSGSRSPSQSAKYQYSKSRPEPRHRGAQGAVEPESGSEGEDGSDASTSRNSSSASYSHSSSDESEEDSDKVRSLTRQLAETAVGVREMSKQLGV